MRSPNDKGVALTVVIIVIIMLALLAGYVTQLGYNQRRLAESAGGKRSKVYYYAQAGVVNALFRIRENHTGAGPGYAALPVGGDFNNPAYDPPAYVLDVDGDNINDASVDISQVGATTAGLRDINSTGLDN